MRVHDETMEPNLKEDTWILFAQQRPYALVDGDRTIVKARMDFNLASGQ